ncbi:MAG: beta-N-acetylhexosaminidase [Bacteroidales bacterium]|nr:beta-N-acetylhexosaminidase [Bacteroidales bacterium]
MLGALMIGSAARSATPQEIIPAPVSIQTRTGQHIYTGDELVIRTGTKAFAKKTADLPDFAKEGAYELKISRNRISIEANGELGVFYAMQSLNIMLGRMNVEDKPTCTTLECCTIFDYPRFPYRGLMIDTSRYFRSKKFLLRQIDAMALMKMSVLHLHLTDDEGWRMQIDRYPRLTAEASHRWCFDWDTWRRAGRRLVPEGTPGSYGGYYTKDDLREIVAYAETKHILVIPEIEMPGHSAEVFKTYTELACTSVLHSIERQKDPDAKRTARGELDEPGTYRLWDLCAGKDATFEFLENVLDEVMEVFPSKYIHIGGDEAIKKAWVECKDCQKRMADLGLETVDELQSYFIKRIEKFVNSRGRSIIGWNEILKGGLAPNATVMSWRGIQGGLEAISQDHDVVMTPEQYCYLDRYQDNPDNCPRAFGTYVPLKKTYSFDPADPSIPKEKLHHLLGVQGNLWAEFVPTDSHAEYMLYPRAFAIAETGWSPAENKDYDKFRERAILFEDLLKANGYNVFDLRTEMGEPTRPVTESY